MKYLVVVIGVVLLVVVMVCPSESDTKFNPMTGQWELAAPDAKLEFNPFNGTWGYVPGSSANEQNQGALGTDFSSSTWGICDTWVAPAFRNQGRSGASGGNVQMWPGFVQH